MSLEAARRYKKQIETELNDLHASNAEAEAELQSQLHIKQKLEHELGALRVLSISSISFFSYHLKFEMEQVCSIIFDSIIFIGKNIILC